MQSGHIRVNGRWWILKVREWVVKDGAKKRVDSYKKLRQVRYNEGKQVPGDVQALANLELAKVNVGQGQGQSADLLKSYLESFLAAGIGSKKRRPLSEETLRSYRRDYAVIEEFIPNIQLRQVRTKDINQIFKMLIESDGDDVRAQSAYNNIKNFLSGALKVATGDGAIDVNPVRDAFSISGNDADTHAYTLEEVHDIMSAVSDHTLQAAFMVWTFTGLRKEEIKGLRWEDYDRENEVLNINRAVVNSKIVDVKTKGSKAPVPVVGIVKKYLDAHLKRNTGAGFIFHGEDDQKPIAIEHLIYEVAIPACEKAGIEWHGTHAFRRGLASVLHDLGVAELTVSHILRHSAKSSKSVAAKHYIKPSLKKMREALEKVEAKYKAIEKKRERG
jgi:integrase